MKRVRRIPMMAERLSLGHSVIPCAAEPPKGRSITLGNLTFSDHGIKEVKGKANRQRYAPLRSTLLMPVGIRVRVSQALRCKLDPKLG
jgi:hypothetical protein